jgi:Flp pilus assembly protein TadB
MPSPTGPSGSAGGGPGPRRHFRYGGGDLRASDAERAEVADRLSRHYQDGRLDQAEFNERLDRAMNAKTRGDFSGLFYDLPDLQDPADQPGSGGQSSQSRQPSGPAFNPGRMQRRSGQRGSLSYAMFLCCVVVLTIVVAHTLLHSFVLWALLAVVGLLLLHSEHHRRRS